MIPRPRAPRGWRPSMALTIAVMAIAFPLGVLANHQFDDVPATASYHDDVEALVNAGITSGCGGGSYCPNNAVTRGQMAQFLNRLGSLDGDTFPSVNADRVDGLHADELTRMSSISISATTPIPEIPSEVQYGGDLTIEAPTAGFVQVTASVTVQNVDCAAGCNAWGQVEHVESAARSNFSLATPQPTPDSYVVLAWSTVFEVEAGTNTFGIILTRDDDTSGTLNGWWGQASALFGPFGSSGGPVITGQDGPPVSPLAKEP